MKAFADDKINVSQKLKFSFKRVEKNAGKRENVGYQHFLLFLQCFQKAFFTELLKVGTMRKKVNTPPCILMSRKTSLYNKSIKSISSNNRANYEVELSFEQKKIRIAKSFGPCQPARIAQADMGQYFSQMHLAGLKLSFNQVNALIVWPTDAWLFDKPHPMYETQKKTPVSTRISARNR